MNYLIDYILEFALTYSELESIDPRDMRRMLKNIASAIYQSDKYKKRGEFDELILHVVIREIYDTISAISKIYNKDGLNDIVKGFDAVHINKENGLELRLGEGKKNLFYYKIKGITSMKKNNKE